MITARLFEYISQQNIKNILREMNEVQYFTYEKVRQYQFKKIKELIEHSNKNVPYYKNMFRNIGMNPEDIQNIEDLSKIPVLTKDIIINNIKDMISISHRKEELIPNSTGGSTGEPLHVFQDKRFELWADAGRVRAARSVGYRFGDTCGLLWGAVRDISQEQPLGQKIKNIVRHGLIQLNAFKMGEKEWHEFIRWCRLFRPKFLRGYVTALHDFAIFLDDNRIRFPKISGVILGAETLDEQTRAFMERVFQAPCFNTYGGRELSLIAFECNARQGLHETSENNYVEYEKTAIFGCDDAADLIITNLNNYAMPFIRYRIGDLGVPSQNVGCRCGRGLPMIQRVIGRSTEVFVFQDGTRIAGEMFIHLMKDFSVHEYQFVQVSESRILLRLKKNETSEEQKRAITSCYLRYLPAEVKLEIDEVDEFQKTRTGKFRFVFRQFNDPGTFSV